MDKSTTATAASLAPEQESVLEELGFVLSDPADLDYPRPLEALSPDGDPVLLRLVPLPVGAGRAALLRRLAELKRLRHPGLARLLELHELPGSVVAACWQRVEGVDLAVLLGARGRLRRDEAAQLLVDLGEALAHLHEQGLAHGDVSPANTVITPQGHAVLIDLLGDAQERGTEPFAAPERSCGTAPEAAGDVRALAALVEQAVAAQRTALGHLVLLEDAMSDDPAQRPTARELAERAPRLAAPAPIELPEESGLAAGVLRACVQSPTRRGTQASWLPRLLARPAPRASKRCGRQTGVKTGGTRAGQGWERRRGMHSAAVRRSYGGASGRVMVAVLGLLLAIGGAQWFYWPEGQAPGAVAAEAPTAAVTAPATEAPSTEEPAPTTTADATSADLLPVVLDLMRARDGALQAQDGVALAATSVPDSPAARADEALLNTLQQSEEVVSGLRTELQDVSEVPVAGLSLSVEAPVGARAVRATVHQPACTRVSATGSRVVPVQSARRVVLVLAPGPWRVLEVLAAE